VPVVPIGLRGTRSLLRSGSWFPRRGAVTVVVAAPLLPAGPGWSAAVDLRDRGRAALLRASGEPDLATPPQPASS
jgi:hypothetical protein